MILDQIIERLKARLTEALPGVAVQQQMAPVLKHISPSGFKLFSETRPGGVLVLLYPYNGELHLPLILRTEYNGTHSGQVSFPGGKKEDNDPDLIYTALRESSEELGIPEKEVRVLGVLSELFIAASNFKVLPVVGYMRERPKFRIEQREVAEIIEVPLSLLLDSKVVKTKSFKVSTGFTIQAPYYAIKEHTVWGATAMMLSEFLSIYKDL